MIMELAEILKIVIWPATLLLFAVFFTIFFRSPIGELLKKFIFRFKKGNAEFEVSQQIPETKIETSVTGNSMSPPVIQVESQKILESDSKSPDDLMNEMIRAILNGEFEKGKSLYKQLQESERDPVEKSKREGVYYYFLYQRGDTSALSRITELTKNPDISHYAHYWLGLCYETSQDFDKAFSEHKIAAENAKSQEQRALYIVHCARSLHESGKKNDALKYIMRELANASETNALAALYNGLASLYLLDESYELRGLALEKAIEYQPNDPDLLFQAGYSYSQVEFNELSLLHYNTLLHFSPENDMALNNIGVAYSRLSMPIKSIDHQKKAFDFGNTLAASNIALGYIGAGFSDEAKQIIEKANEQKDVHRNVGSTFSEIIDKKEKEQKREKETLDSAKEQQRFMRSFGEAYFLQTPEISNINGNWTFPDGTDVTIVQQNETFTLEWTENKQAYGLKGNLTNRAAQITITAPSYRVNDEISNKLFITPDYKTINLMIKRYGKFEYIKLVKKQNETAAVL